jgi:predicted RNA-binding Zn-ribbon protein involved in translation (DUF1610 family)
MIAKSQCPNCGTDLEFESENTMPGQAVPCPSCGKSVRLTAPQSTPPATVPLTPQPLKNLWRCNACHELMSRNAYACPHCGDPIKSPIPTLFYIVAIVYLIIGALVLLAALNNFSKL